jgi:hypothetical protein
MNYYIIPKNNFNINIDLQINSNKTIPYISYSLIFYLNEIYSQILKINNHHTQYHSDNNYQNANPIINTNYSDSEIHIDFINKIINPYEFLYTNVPGSVISVSKVKPDSNIFFELMEVFQLSNTLDMITKKEKFNIGYFSPNYSSIQYLFNVLREENEDAMLYDDFDYNNLCSMFITTNFQVKFNFLFFELKSEDYLDPNKYSKQLLLVLYIIIKYQSDDGLCIIKMDNIFYKPIVDILFLLSGIYDRVYIVKPSVTNITKGDRYIVCRMFNLKFSEEKKIEKQLQEKVLINLLSKDFQDENTHLHSIISNNIPYHFLNKIEESNAVIGQQQLESYDHIINIIKNKTRDDKIETLKRNHIQKCIQWCEKNQLPHNKFIDKINIFLTSKKKEIEDEKGDKILEINSNIY